MEQSSIARELKRSELAISRDKLAIKTDTKRVSSGRAVKTLFPSHMIAKTSIGFLEFVIFESEDESEIAEYVMAYTVTDIKMKVYPIWETSKFLEIWKKMKK